MASYGLQKELNCPICLDIYSDPVTLKCSHIFCHNCIKSVLDCQEASGEYCCPECRLQFQQRPLLEKNRKLCNIVEHFRLVCIDQEDSMHNKPSVDISTEPEASLQKPKCSMHEKPLEFYCFDDALCVCEDCCFSGEHGGHQVELLDEAVELRRKAVNGFLQALSADKAETVKTVQSLRESVTEAKEKVSSEQERATTLFKDLRRQLEHLEKKVLDDISCQGEHAIHLGSDLIQQLEMKTEKLSQKIQDLEMTVQVTEPLAFLQAAGCIKLGEDNPIEDTKKDVNTQPDLVIVGLLPETLHAGLENIMADAKKMLPLKEQPEQFNDIEAIEKCVESASLPYGSLGQTPGNVKPYHSAHTEKKSLQSHHKTDMVPSAPVTHEPYLLFRNPYSFLKMEQPE